MTGRSRSDLRSRSPYRTALGPPLLWQQFVGPNSATVVPAPTVGAAGSALTGNWGVASNKGYCSNVSGGRYAYRWDPGVADVTISALVTLGATNADCGIYFHMADAANGYLLNFSRNPADQLGLYRQVSGSFTLLSSVAGLTLGQTYQATIALSGASKTVYLGGAPVLSSTTPHALDTETGVGLDCNSASDTSSRFDEIVVR